jgi:hypothetical protein
MPPGRRSNVHDRPVTVSSAQADAFYTEVLAEGSVWTVRDTGGIPAPETPDGRAMPFWSKRSRVEAIIENVPAYSSFEIQEIPTPEWRLRWLPRLGRDGLRIGLNWSGVIATGFDRAPEDVERNLAAREAA